MLTNQEIAEKWANKVSFHMETPVGRQLIIKDVLSYFLTAITEAIQQQAEQIEILKSQLADVHDALCFATIKNRPDSRQDGSEATPEDKKGLKDVNTKL